MLKLHRTFIRGWREAMETWYVLDSCRRAMASEVRESRLKIKMRCLFEISEFSQRIPHAPGMVCIDFLFNCSTQTASQANDDNISNGECERFSVVVVPFICCQFGGYEAKGVPQLSKILAKLHFNSRLDLLTGRAPTAMPS